MVVFFKGFYASEPDDQHVTEITLTAMLCQVFCRRTFDAPPRFSVRRLFSSDFTIRSTTIPKATRTRTVKRQAHLRDDGSSVRALVVVGGAVIAALQ